MSSVIRYQDFINAINAAKQTYRFCDKITKTSSTTIAEAKKIPGALRARIGLAGVDNYGFQPIKDWVTVDGVQSVKDFFTAELRGGPANILGSLRSAELSARLLANYVHDNVSSLAETNTVKLNDTEIQLILPQTHLDSIILLAEDVKSHLVLF